MSPLETPPSPARFPHHAAAGSRRYRSKAQRPCDLCRARKALCNIPDPSRPCQLCDRTGRPCTFLAGTKSRPTRCSPGRSSADDGAADSLADQTPLTASSFSRNDARGDLVVDNPTSLSPAFGGHPLGMDEMLPTQWSPDLEQLGQAEAFMQDIPNFWSIPYGDASVMGTADSAVEPNSGNEEALSRPQVQATLNRHDRSTSFIGYSNESDPFLLEHYPYNAADELDFFMVTYRRPSSQPVSAGHPPIHFLQSKPQAVLQNQEAMTGCLALKNERDLLNEIVSVEMGVALLRLYLRFIFQNLPIISRTELLKDEEEFIKSTSPGVLAGMYALALPFTSWDEQFCLDSAYSKPDVNRLWQVSYSCLQRELHFPSLSTVQISLLLLNTTTFDPVAVETPFAWSLACSALAVAQSLGLHVDPGPWRGLPAAEARLRRRLWWTVVAEHGWRAVTHGRASMLREDDCNVTPISHADFAGVEDAHGAADYFIHFCALTDIVSEICRSFFTLRTVSKVQDLKDIMDRARPLQRALHRWLESLPPSLSLDQPASDATNSDVPDSRASLHVAYFTARVLLLRALLRPIVRPRLPDDHDDDSAVHEVLQESRDFMRALIAVVRGLDLRYTAAFWPAYARHCLCYPGLFCYMLCFQRRSPRDRAGDEELFARWRGVLRARVGAWPLLRFAVVKVDAVFWKKMEHTREKRQWSG
ncbi:fungal specific transcription factor domain protein [Cordyceps fumosorosea ARSEF 2679]|uniref:Fungal specific transcription factor domain protein n=1 Tax=Cordyceps fumosorosea (strain ARSEF 2679) TaxID=1081104 RepID=A0A167XGE2_CORFA|nr:fungal specific transcription factor domain protein [Cordyceps fumosorosea ARSEF 2679]OAA64951.1 fungal specific transcription factor domain protein [Cordyceps fumosorosea ARSEF 2679]